MKTAVIIGATSGMGEALTSILVRDGYRVAATGRRVEKLEALREAWPDQIVPVQMDVRDTADTAAKLNDMAAHLGGIDLFVLSSGTGDLNPTFDFGIEQETIHTNVIGFTNIADWCVRYFTAQKNGQLVFISSVAGLRGGRGAASYNATKAYQINYIEGIRQKFTHDKLPIAVTDIRPGFIDTAMAKGEGLFWVMPVDKAAQRIYRAIRKRKSVSYLSCRWSILAQVFKTLPRFLYKHM